MALTVLTSPLNLIRRLIASRDTVTLFATAIANNGSWSTLPYNWQGTTTTFLTTNVTSADELNTSAIFPLRFDARANFSITINTPGCVQDDSCALRGLVNVTSNVIPTSCGNGTALVPFSTIISQANNFDKYDPIYFGFMSGVTDDFEPSITLTPASGQSFPLNIVAQAVRLQRLSGNDSSEFDVCGDTASSSAPEGNPSSTNPASVTNSASSTGDPSADGSKDGGALSGGAKAGIAVGIVGAAIAIILAVFLLLRRRKMKLAAEAKNNEGWSGKPELAGNEVSKHAWLAEKDGRSPTEMSVESKPQEMEAEVPRVELPCSEVEARR